MFCRTALATLFFIFFIRIYLSSFRLVFCLSQMLVANIAFKITKKNRHSHYIRRKFCIFSLLYTHFVAFSSQKHIFKSHLCVHTHAPHPSHQKQRQAIRFAREHTLYSSCAIDQKRHQAFSFTNSSVPLLPSCSSVKMIIQN